jgi:hypothetical protein
MMARGKGRQLIVQGDPDRQRLLDDLGRPVLECKMSISRNVHPSCVSTRGYSYQRSIRLDKCAGVVSRRYLYFEREVTARAHYSAKGWVGKGRSSMRSRKWFLSRSGSRAVSLLKASTSR